MFAIAWYLLHLVHFNAYFILICSSFSYSHLIRRLNAMLMTIARIISFAHMLLMSVSEKWNVWAKILCAGKTTSVWGTQTMTIHIYICCTFQIIQSITEITKCQSDTLIQHSLKLNYRFYYMVFLRCTIEIERLQSSFAFL